MATVDLNHQALESLSRDVADAWQRFSKTGRDSRTWQDFLIWLRGFEPLLAREVESARDAQRDYLVVRALGVAPPCLCRKSSPAREFILNLIVIALVCAFITAALFAAGSSIPLWAR